MIIEAGYDVRELFLPTLLSENALGKRPLILMAMNADLRLLFVSKVTEHMDADFETYIEPIFEMLTSKRRDIETLIPFYFAIAYMVPGNNGGLERHFHHEELDQQAKRRGFHCLGEQVFDDEYWNSSGPMYSFEDYPSNELPRAMVYRGPHPFANCPCPPCSTKRARLKANWERNLASSEETN